MSTRTYRLIRASHAAYERWQRATASRQAVGVMFVWAFAEAIIWPVIPDVLLVALVAGSPQRAGRFVLAATAGSSLGGVLLLVAAAMAADRVPEILALLPLVTDRHIAVAKERLGELGPLGFAIQPWSGVAFRVWALVAAGMDLNLWLVAITSIAARAARMLLTGLAARLFVGLLPRVVRDYWLVLAALYGLAVAIAWAVLTL